MADSFHNLAYHVSFSTMERARLINDELAGRPWRYLGGIVREEGGAALAVNGASDHVHISTRLPATRAIADAIRVVKANSLRWIHGTWTSRGRFAWRGGYAAFSVSRSLIGDVAAYIARQAEHHRRVTFQDELIAFLRRNGIEYDERYRWE